MTMEDKKQKWLSEGIASIVRDEHAIAVVATYKMRNEYHLWSKAIDDNDAWAIGKAVVKIYIAIRSGDRNYTECDLDDETVFILTDQNEVAYIDQLFERDMIKNNKDEQIGLRWYATELLGEIIDDAIQLHLEFLFGVTR